MGKKYAVLTLRMSLMLFVIALWVSGIVIVATALLVEVYLHSYLSPEFSGTAVYVLLGIGLLYVIFSFAIGFCLSGAGPALLSVYGAFLTIVCVINIGVGVSIATYKSTFTKTIYDGLMQGIHQYPYDGGINYVSRNMDIMQRKGCFERVMKTAEENSALLISVGIIAALYPLVGAILSCCLAHVVHQDPARDAQVVG